MRKILKELRDQSLYCTIMNQSYVRVHIKFLQELEPYLELAGKIINAKQLVRYDESISGYYAEIDKNDIDFINKCKELSK